MAEEFTIAPFRRLLKKEGDFRLSPEAVEEMRRIVGGFGLKLAHEAVANSLKEGRRTVLERDIKVAYLRVKELEEE